MPLDSAMALIQRRRPEAEPIPDFMAMLGQYEAQCRSDGAIVDLRTGIPGKNKKRTAGAVGPACPGAVGPQKRAVVGPLPGPIDVPVDPMAHPSKTIGPTAMGHEESLPDPESSPSTLSNASSPNSKKFGKNHAELSAKTDSNEIGSQSSSHESTSTDESIKD